MKKLGGILKGVVGMLLLAGLAVVLSLTFQRPAGEELASSPKVSLPAMQEGPVATMVAQSPLPTPTEDTTFWSPLPTPTEEPTPMPSPTPAPTEEFEGYVEIEGTRTVFPTHTPRPTPTPLPSPTRRPGPTATPWPLPRPAADAAGVILYTVRQESKKWTTLELLVDEQGQKTAEPMPLTFPLDFAPVVLDPSPDGHYLLLLRPTMPGGIPYIFDRETGQAQLLFHKYPDPYVTGEFFGWHPNSQQVLFWSLDIAMWLVDAETGEYTPLALIDGPVQGAAISPQGQKIAYMVSNDLSSNTMWMVSAAGGDARPLFDIQSPSAYLFGWSPDGAYILYYGGVEPPPDKSSTPAPGGPLWLVDADGRNHQPLYGPFILGWQFRPVWSPDSRYVAFVGPAADEAFGCIQTDQDKEPDWETCWFQGTRIYIEDIVTGEVRDLMSGIRPTWSPDGSMLAFLSDRSGTPEIWIINADGSGLHQLTDDGLIKEHHLAWFQPGR